MASKYHVTPEGKVGPCQARTRPCRYGEAAHHATRDEANKAGEKVMAKLHEATRKALKKKRLSESYTLQDLQSPTLSQEEKVKIKLFNLLTTMENEPGTYEERRLMVGYPPDGAFATGASPTLHTSRKVADEVLAEERQALAAFTQGEKVVPELVKQGWQVDLVKGSFQEESRARFRSTYTESSDWDVYVSARGVFTSPRGAKVELPVAAYTNVKDVAREAARRDNPNYGTYRDPSYVMTVAESMSTGHSEEY